MTVVVVMGVSGAGKSTVARVLAERLGVPFAEGDDFHPAANVAKMAAGQPLTDEDRLPWLHRLARWVSAADGAGVLTCSALRRAYRDMLGDVWFAHLAAPLPVIAARLAARRGHFMPPSLLQSQFDTLEPLGPDERGALYDVTGGVDAVTVAIHIVRDLTLAEH